MVKLKAKIFGMILGDGWLSVGVNKRNSMYYRCGCSGDPEGLKNLQRDLTKAFGIENGNIYTYQTSSPKYGISGTTSSINIRTAVAKELIKLGMPIGKRTEVEFLLPEWIVNGNREVKEGFISGLFAAEGSIPKMQKNDKTLKTPTITLTKRKTFEKNFYAFIKQLSDVLSDLNIEHNIKFKITHTIAENIRADIVICNNQENLYRLFHVLDLDYCPKKNEKLQYLRAYYDYRQEMLEKIKQAKEEAITYRNIPARIIAEKYGLTQSHIEHFRYDNAGVQLPKSILTFTEFKQLSSPTKAI